MNKLTKVLSVFIIAGAVGASVAGIAGCKKDKGHSHSIDPTKWTDNEDALTHDGFCSCGHLMVDDEEHLYDNGECIKCHAIEGAEAVTVTGVTVSAAGSVTSVAVEGKLKLSATVTGTGNPPQTVTWSSSDESKATVSDTGLVTGVAKGEVTITATSTKDTSKSDTITLTVVAKGTLVTIPDYETLTAQDDKLYNNDFETAAARLPDFSGSYGGTRGVYTAFAVNKDTAGATNETHYVKAEGGKAVQVNPGAGTAYTVVDFGAIKGDIEGYIDITLSEAANGMTFVQFIGNSEARTNSEVFGLRTDGGAIKYRLDGGTTYVGADPAISTVTQMAVYFRYADGKMTVAINDTLLCKDLETTITKLSGFRLASGDGNTRTVNADNVVFCGEEMSVADYSPAVLANLETEYGKYVLTGTGATHTVNGSLVTKAYNDGVTAIGAASTIAAINAAYDTAVAAMKDVLADADIATAKAAAKTALAEKFPADNYTYDFADSSDDAIYNNKTKYGQEIAAIEALIENGATTKSNLDAIVAGATVTIGDNATQLAAKKTAVTGSSGIIATYKATETAAIETTYPTQYANIGNIKTTAVADINAATTTTIEAINTIIAQAKADIDSEIASTQETLDQTIARYQGYLEADGTTAKTGVTDENKIAAVDAAVTAGKAEIAKVASKDNVNAVYKAEQAKVLVAIPKYEAKATLLTDKNSAIDEIHGDSEAATTATTAVTKAYDDGIEAIDGAADADEVDTALDTAQKAIAGAITTLNDSKFEVTLGTTGEKLSVKYGTELTLGNISVTAYNVTEATYGASNTPITAESGVTVYDDITVNVTTAEKSNYSPAEKWEGSEVSEATAVGGEGVVQDNGLYKLTVQATSTYVSTGVANNSSGKQFTTATVNGTAYANVINVCPVAGGGNCSATPITIEVKDNLKTLKIYTLGAGANGTDNRPGSTYYVINDGEPTVVSGQAQAYELTNLQGGDVVKVYISNTSGSGGNLYLAKVEAAIDETKVAKTVTVKWKGAGASGADVTEEYRYFDKITAPAYTNLGDSEDFDFWHIEGDENQKWTNGSSLSGGSYTYVVKTKQVAAVASIELSAGDATEIEIGGSVTLTAVAKDAGGATLDRTVGWDLGGYENAKVSSDGKLTLLAGATVGDTITVKAKVGTVLSNAITLTVAEAAAPVEATKAPVGTMASGATVIEGKAGEVTVFKVTTEIAVADDNAPALASENGGKILKFELAAGYTYTVTVKANFQGNGRVLTLNNVNSSKGEKSTNASKILTATWTISDTGAAQTLYLTTNDTTLSSNKGTLLREVTVVATKA